MFSPGKNQYSSIETQFNSFNTDNKSIRKSPKVSYSLKSLVPLQIPWVLLRTPWRLHQGKLGLLQGKTYFRSQNLTFEWLWLCSECSKLNGCALPPTLGAPTVPSVILHKPSFPWWSPEKSLSNTREIWSGGVFSENNTFWDFLTDFSPVFNESN